MKIHFESDYRTKLLTVRFTEELCLESKSDIASWRSQWLAVLGSWHSPYKALIDCENLTKVDVRCAEDLKSMFRFLDRFFLRKVVGFSEHSIEGVEFLPFEVVTSSEKAATALGLREFRAPKPGDFRSIIQFDNHFEQQVVEVHFSEYASFDSPEKIEIFKSKLTNNLMQWHSSWSLLFDCSQFRVASEQVVSLTQTIDFFRKFFLQDVVGYGVVEKKDTYPFPVYKSRHKAAASLKKEVAHSGRDANCSSRK